MQPNDVITLLFVLQALIAFAMGGVALGLAGRRLHMGRRLLAGSFFALGLYFVASLLSNWLATLGPQWALTRSALSWLSQFGGFAHLALLMLALYSMALRRGVSRKVFLWVMGISVVAALLIVLPGSSDLSEARTRYGFRVGGRSAITALGYGLIAAFMARYKPLAGRSLGQLLVMSSFGVLFLFNALTASAVFHPGLLGSAPGTSAWLQLGSLIGLLLLAIALLVWLQERTLALAEAKTLNAERMAHFDEATGLVNRHGLLRRLDRDVTPASALTIMTLRLHRFALMERTLGSTWVQEALQRLGEAMVAGRDYHLLVLARIDSDRLAVALAADGSLADGEVLSRRREVERVALSLGHPVALSFGYAVRGQRESAGTILASACLAQEKAEAGGLRMLRFEPEQALSDADEVKIVGALYRAIGEDQLFLEYQGIFKTHTGALDCVEALVRWRHPTEGVMPPGRFLPAAERGGLMADIDIWVLTRVCQTLRDRKDAGEPAVPVAINLSAASLLDGGLPSVVESQLRRNGVDPHLLEIEVTESAAMNDLSKASAVVNALRELGVRVALDDLGTGYSSLVHLRDLRADRLKIDRSFLVEGDRFGNAIAAAIGALGRSLGCDVVGEGVETEAQLAFCKAHHIGFVQGWLLHRPAERWPQPPAG